MRYKLNIVPTNNEARDVKRIFPSTVKSYVVCRANAVIIRKVDNVCMVPIHTKAGLNKLEKVPTITD